MKGTTDDADESGSGRMLQGALAAGMFLQQLAGDGVRQESSFVGQSDGCV